jgi:hypothetical protein
MEQIAPSTANIRWVCKIPELAGCSLMATRSRQRMRAPCSDRINGVEAFLTCENWVHLALLWQILAIDWRNWIPESDFQ